MTPSLISSIPACCVIRSLAATYVISSLQYFQRKKTVFLLNLFLVVPAIGVPDVLFAPWVASVDSTLSVVIRATSLAATFVLVFASVRQHKSFVLPLPPVMQTCLYWRAQLLVVSRAALVSWPLLAFAVLCVFVLPARHSLPVALVVALQWALAWSTGEIVRAEFQARLLHARGFRDRCGDTFLYARSCVPSLGLQLAVKVAASFVLGAFIAYQLRGTVPSIGIPVAIGLLVAASCSLSIGVQGVWRDSQRSRAVVLATGTRNAFTLTKIRLIVDVSVALAMATGSMLAFCAADVVHFLIASYVSFASICFLSMCRIFSEYQQVKRNPEFNAHGIGVHKCVESLRRR